VAQVLDAQNNAIPYTATSNIFINFLTWGPLVDPLGEIPEQPLFILQKKSGVGNIAKVPLLAGVTRDEGTLFVYNLLSTSIPSYYYSTVLKMLFPNHYQRINVIYPSSGSDQRVVISQLVTDMVFFCPLRNVSRAYSSHFQSPVYLYKFNHILSFNPWPSSQTYCRYKICHGSDLPFAFNSFDDNHGISFSPTNAEKKLADGMNSAWANFVTSSNPNNGSTIYLQFPLYNISQNEIAVLNDTGIVEKDTRKKYCDFWDSISYSALWLVLLLYFLFNYLILNLKPTFKARLY
jgi:carboxylesterase type B